MSTGRWGRHKKHCIPHVIETSIVKSPVGAEQVGVDTRATDDSLSHVERDSDVCYNALDKPTNDQCCDRGKVVTFGHHVNESQFLEAFEVHGIRSLMDVRQVRPNGNMGLHSRRQLAQICAQRNVQHERMQLAAANSNVMCHRVLQAALSFASQPAAFLCEESDPRNGERRLLGDALVAMGWRVSHIMVRGSQVYTIPHQDLFFHEGNTIMWPPPATAISYLNCIDWQDLGDESLNDGRRYLIMLPWNTQLAWVPDWLSPSAADNLLSTVQERIRFYQPKLMFERGHRMIEAQQPRRSAWVCDCYNQPAQIATAVEEGHVLEPSVLAAHPLEAWSRKLMAHAEATACSKFNALLLHTYDHGMHSMGFHSDTDEGLGDQAVIASFSLGETRTFAIKSQKPWEGRRIELSIPMKHGSFLIMGPRFQSRWLHSLPKMPGVTAARVNGTLRFYDLPPGAMLCACGASRKARNQTT